MIRKAFLMSVDKEKHNEYKKRHDEIWPELVNVLKEYGASEYSIFLDDKNSQLFAFVHIESEEKWNCIAKTEVCKKWWAYMKDIMPSNPDNSPISTELQEVFYLK